MSSPTSNLATTIKQTQTQQSGTAVRKGKDSTVTISPVHPALKAEVERFNENLEKLSSRPSEASVRC